MKWLTPKAHQRYKVYFQDEFTKFSNTLYHGNIMSSCILIINACIKKIHNNPASIPILSDTPLLVTKRCSSFQYNLA